VAKSVLESSGIDAMIHADTAGRMREHLASSGPGHRVLVREEDVAAALLSAEIFATIRYDSTYYQLLVNEEDEAAGRKVLKALPKARPWLQTRGTETDGGVASMWSDSIPPRLFKRLAATPTV